MSENSVVVPWDFSNHSQASLDFARSKFADSAVRTICVLETPNPYHPGFNWGQTAKDKAIANCREQFNDQTGIAPDAAMELTVKFGQPAEQIIEFANEEDASFIVISTHGRSGFQRLLIGSVAQKVMAAAICPVILLPNQWYQQKQSCDDDHQYRNKLINEFHRLDEMQRGENHV